MIIKPPQLETMDFRQRLEQSRIKPIGNDAPAELEENFACPYFATDKTKSPACLELRLSGGNHKAIPYSYFTEINFEADAGIEILTTQKTNMYCWQKSYTIYIFILV